MVRRAPATPQQRHALTFADSSGRDCWIGTAAVFRDTPENRATLQREQEAAEAEAAARKQARTEARAKELAGTPPQSRQRPDLSFRSGGEKRER